MTEVSTVIFDLDGCLVDSEPHALEAVAAELREIGLTSARAEDIRDRFLGVSMTDICKDITQRSELSVQEDFVDRVEKRLFAVYSEKLQPIEGANTWIDQLEEADVATAIATGGSVPRMNETLKLGGLAERFEGRGFSADEVAQGKPAPDLFLHAAAILRVNPDQCAVLEVATRRGRRTCCRNEVRRLCRWLPPRRHPRCASCNLEEGWGRAGPRHARQSLRAPDQTSSCAQGQS